MSADILDEGRSAVAICLDCEWSSVPLRNTDAAAAMADFHNRHKHGANT